MKWEKKAGARLWKALKAIVGNLQSILTAVRSHYHFGHPHALKLSLPLTSLSIRGILDITRFD